jgi:hypothetical protein
VSCSGVALKKANKITKSSSLGDRVIRSRHVAKSFWSFRCMAERLSYPRTPPASSHPVNGSRILSSTDTGSVLPLQCLSTHNNTLLKFRVTRMLLSKQGQSFQPISEWFKLDFRAGTTVITVAVPVATHCATFVARSDVILIVALVLDTTLYAIIAFQCFKDRQEWSVGTILKRVDCLYLHS